MTTNAGIHLFTVFDDRCTDSLIIITCVEIILVSWVYDMRKSVKGDDGDMAWWKKATLKLVSPGIFYDNIDEMHIWMPK